MKERAILFGNGHYDQIYDYLNEVSYDPKTDYIVAVDGGLDYLDLKQIKPDLIIGDLDSTTIDPGKVYPQTELIKHPAKKNETDTELAIEIVQKKGIQSICFIGMTGDRIDHSLANILLLESCAKKGIEVQLIDKKNSFYCVIGPAILKTQFRKGQTVSLIPVTKKVTQLTLTGFEYPLNRFKLKRKHPGRAVSNIVKEEKQEIKFKKGTLLIDVIK